MTAPIRRNVSQILEKDAMGSDIEVRPTAVYTLQEVARVLNISDSTVRKHLKQGRLKGTQFGRAYRFLGKHVLDYMETEYLRTVGQVSHLTWPIR